VAYATHTPGGTGLESATIGDIMAEAEKVCPGLASALATSFPTLAAVIEYVADEASSTSLRYLEEVIFAPNDYDDLDILYFIAPTDEAFTELLTTLGVKGLDEVDPQLAAQVLLNHIGTTPFGEIDGDGVTVSVDMLGGEEVFLWFYGFANGDKVAYSSLPGFWMESELETSISTRNSTVITLGEGCRSTLILKTDSVILPKAVLDALPAITAEAPAPTPMDGDAALAPDAEPPAPAPGPAEKDETVTPLAPTPSPVAALAPPPSSSSAPSAQGLAALVTGLFAMMWML
jgi:hypothetical protein